LKLDVCMLSASVNRKPTTERVLLAYLDVELWSLFVTSGKLVG